MPKVKMPSGEIVEMPDVLTPELAERLKSLQSGSPTTPTVKPPEEGILDKASRYGSGALDAAKTVASSVPASLLGVTAGLGNVVRGNGTFEQGFSDNAGRYTRPPQTPTGSKIVEGIGRVAESAQGLGPEFGGYGSIMKGAAVAGETAMPTLRAASTVAAPIARSAESLGGKVVNPINSAVGSMVPKVTNPFLVDLAKQAETKGIPVRAAQLTDSPVRNFVSDLVTSATGRGKDAQLAANRAIAKELGVENLPNGIMTKDIYGKRVKEVGQKIGELSSKNPVTLTGDSPLATKLNALLQDDRLDPNLLTPEIKRIMAKADETTGKINGTQFAELQRVFRDKSYTASDELAPNLKAVSDAMAAQIREGLSVEDRAAFDLANSQYSKAMALQSQMGKDAGRTGHIDFSELENFYNRPRQQYKTAMDADSGLRKLTDIGKAFVEPKRVIPPIVKYGLPAVGVGVGAPTAIHQLMP